MLTPDAKIARIAQRQHGAFSRAQAYGVGIAPHTLRAGVRTNRLNRPYRDVFTIAGAPSTYEQSVMIAELAAGSDTAAAARTAGRLWQITDARFKGVQLLVPAERHLVIAGVDVLRTRTLIAKDFTSIGAIRITTGTRTVIDLAREIERDELEDTLDAALRRGLTSVRQLEKRMKGMDR